MDKRIKLDDYREVFSFEELNVLKIFQVAGYDLIKRVEEKDLVVCKITKQNEDDVIRSLVGELIPEEWFESIEPETEYHFEDIFMEEIEE